MCIEKREQDRLSESIMLVLVNRSIANVLSETDFQHAMFTKLFNNKLSLAPIETISLHRVLDIATGTGKSSSRTDDLPL